MLPAYLYQSSLPAPPLGINYSLNSDSVCYNFNIFFLAFHLLDTGTFFVSRERDYNNSLFEACSV